MKGIGSGSGRLSDKTMGTILEAASSHMTAFTTVTAIAADV